MHTSVCIAVTWQDFQVLQLWHNRRHHSRRMAYRLQRFPQRSRLLSSPSLQLIGSGHLCINLQASRWAFQADFCWTVQVICQNRRDTASTSTTSTAMDTYQGHWSVSKVAVKTFPKSPSKSFRCLLLQEVLRIKLTSLTVQGGDADDAQGIGRTDLSLGNVLC